MKRLLLLISPVILASYERKAAGETRLEREEKATDAVAEQRAPAKDASRDEGKAGVAEESPLAFEKLDLEKLENSPQWLVEAIANEPAIEHKHLFLYRSTDADHYEVVTSSVPLAELKKGELPGMGAQFSVRRDRDGKAFVGAAEYFHY